jgi:hypothetical protein
VSHGDTMSDQATEQQQRRRIRRNAIVLGVIAFAIYAAFIVSGVLRAPH